MAKSGLNWGGTFVIMAIELWYVMTSMASTVSLGATPLNASISL